MAMQLWQDGIIALLAAIGLSSLVWILVRALFFLPPVSHSAIILICARGDGEGVEQQVRTLLLLRSQYGIVGQILLVDCGLSEDGKRICRLLARGEHIVTLCASDEIGKYIT